MRRVVITGIGALTSAGKGHLRLMDSLCDRKAYAEPIPDKYKTRYAFKSGFLAPFPRVKLGDSGISAVYESGMQEEDKIAVTAAKLALEDAGFELREENKRFYCPGFPSYGLILGVGLSSLDRAFKSYLAHVVPDFQALAGQMDTKLHYNRMIIPQTMPNSVAAWVSVLFPGAEEHFTVNAACASGTMAIGEAYRKIKDGYSEVMLTGGVEYLADEFGSVMRGFDTLGVLTRNSEGLPMPFSRDRSGFLFAEGGGCVLVLEDMEHARKRGARIWAEIADYRANSDGHNIVQMDPGGKKIVELLGKLKQNNTIDYINAHGTGTEANDEIESAAIREVFGPQGTQPYINSTKGLIGHTLGASGAIEAAVAALSLYQSRIHGNLTENPLEDLKLPAETMEIELSSALSMSYGFGGHNAGLLLKKAEKQ